MIEHGSAAIVNVSSAAGLFPARARTSTPAHRDRSPTAATRWLHHLTRCVAIELQPYGIPVNVLSPVITPGNLYAMAGETHWTSPDDDFAEAMISVALADARDVTGQLL
jgi:NAD(P)-dependent dehydrogenase (short-subunit alcohol dehydrogenase family)